jgi:nitrogen fixation/metabolism regulation signal transduction histidine kinase
MRINISFKLFIGFLTVILFNLLYVVVVYKLTDLNSLASIVSRQNKIRSDGQQNRSATAFALVKSQTSVDNFNTAARQVASLLDSVATELQTIIAYDSALTKKYLAVSSLQETSSLDDIIRSGIIVHLGEYYSTFRQLVNSSDQTIPTTASLRIFLDSSNTVLNEEFKNADALIDAQNMVRMRDIENNIANIKRITLVILSSISIVALLFSLLFSRAITNSLRRLKLSASHIGKGDFNFSPAGYPKDEIGDLAVAFFEMSIDLKNAQEELIKSKRLAAIGEVVASVNHEINNPLMIISGNAQFLEMSMKAFPEDMKERVKIILEETERISNVTRKLREIKNPVVEDYTSSGEQMINLDKSIE